jgi:hypothetical protein
VLVNEYRTAALLGQKLSEEARTQQLGIVMDDPDPMGKNADVPAKIMGE